MTFILSSWTLFKKYYCPSQMSVVQKFWSCDNIFVALPFAKHSSRDAILVVPTKMASHDQ